MCSRNKSSARRSLARAAVSAEAQSTISISLCLTATSYAAFALYETAIASITAFAKSMRTEQGSVWGMTGNIVSLEETSTHSIGSSVRIMPTIQVRKNPGRGPYWNSPLAVRTGTELL